MTKRGFIRFLFISDVDPADGKGHAAKQYLVKNDIIEVFIFYIAVIGMLRQGVGVKSREKFADFLIGWSLNILLN